jgi:hypothetical protein
MAANRRPILTTFAVLNFVFGGLGLICGCITAFGVMALEGMKNTSPQLKQFVERVHHDIPAHNAVKIGTAVALLAACIGLVVAGIGLLMRQPWARWLSLACGLLMLGSEVVNGIFEIAVVAPAIERIQRDLGMAQSAGGSAGGKIGVIFRVLIMGGYGITVAVVMALPVMGDALAGGRRRSRRDYEEDDYDDRYDRRGRDDYDDRGRDVDDRYEDRHRRRRDEYDEDDR